VNAHEFAGTWQLVDSYSERAGARAAFPLGTTVSGRLHYDRAGTMAAQLMGGARAAFSSRDPRAVSDGEYRAAFQSYTAYYGRYTIDAQAGTVTHHVEGATVPNWPGQDQLRYFTLAGRRLTLRTPTMRGNDGEKSVHTLVWEKLT
jgi:hypothetical protein